MGNGVVDAALGYPASEAVHLVLHHVHGGLHNAAMALQLATEPGGGPDDARLVAQSGLEGIAQAARGVSLLTVALGLKAGPGTAPADHQWVQLVETLLQSRARQRRVDLAVDDAWDRAASPPDPEQLVAMLLRGIEAIDSAAPGECVTCPSLTGTLAPTRASLPSPHSP